MQITKKIIIVGAILFLFVFIFFLEPTIEEIKNEDFFEAVSDNDIIIIFNSGGWGDTPPEQADDFASIIEGIKETLTSLGQESVVLPYYRTKNGFWEKTATTKEFFNFFNNSSKNFANNLQKFIEDYPDKKIILAGLSNGGVFVVNTYKEISNQFKGSIYAISVGAPFWVSEYNSANLLKVDNMGKDSLSSGSINKLFLSVVKAPFSWLSAKITGRNITIAQAFHVPGHEYDWTSVEINSEITAFLGDKFK